MEQSWPAPPLTHSTRGRSRRLPLRYIYAALPILRCSRRPDEVRVRVRQHGLL